MRQSATLREVACRAGFTQAVPSDPVEIIIRPTLRVAAAGGGVAADPPAGAWSGSGSVARRPAAAGNYFALWATPPAARTIRSLSR